MLDGLKESDRYLTPDWVIQAELAYWSCGIDLDPFWDPEGRVPARRFCDARQGHDGYGMRLMDGFEPIRTAHVNGPYSGSHPAKTAELVYGWHRDVPRFESVNVCPAAVGSAYWRDFVWTLSDTRLDGGVVVGWAGRLGFEAAVDIHDPDGKVRCPKGVTQSGNRTEIAIVACVERPKMFARLLRKHSPKPMEVTVL